MFALSSSIAIRVNPRYQAHVYPTTSCMYKYIPDAHYESRPLVPPSRCTLPSSFLVHEDLSLAQRRMTRTELC